MAPDFNVIIALVALAAALAIMARPVSQVLRTPTPNDAAATDVTSERSALEIDGGAPIHETSETEGSDALVEEESSKTDQQGDKIREKSVSQAELLFVRDLFAAIDDPIAYKNEVGIYQYCNEAFAKMVKREPSEVVGLEDEELFGFLASHSLMAADKIAGEEGRASTYNEIEIDNKAKIFHIARTSLTDDSGRNQGQVAIWRDQTEQVMEKRRNEQAMRQTIAAFAKSIEFIDPYLAGHTDRLARTGMAVAKAMGFDRGAVMTVEFSAYLSQMGKLSIDPEILSKPGRLSDEEIEAVRRHVHNTARIMADLDFGLAIPDTVKQMHERMDGQGYPAGLTAEAIGPCAKILGACDVFCARIAPRSYRAAISAEQAIGILQQNLHRYDDTVVTTLAELLQGPEREKILPGH